MNFVEDAVGDDLIKFDWIKVITLVVIKEIKEMYVAGLNRSYG